MIFWCFYLPSLLAWKSSGLQGNGDEIVLWVFFGHFKYATGQSGRHLCHGARLCLEYTASHRSRRRRELGVTFVGVDPVFMRHTINLAAFTFPDQRQQLIFKDERHEHV